MELIFEKSKSGKRCATIRPLRVPTHNIKAKYCRSELKLPEVAEVDMARHYTELSRNAFGVDNGFYPLGSCTMKYNPKLNEEIAALPGFAGIHPLQDTDSAKGCLEVIDTLNGYLMEITAMDAISLYPAAGAHGEYLGLLLIGAYHKSKGAVKRNKVLVPDSAHGTNPASAVMAGFEVVSVPSDSEKGVDIEALRALAGDDTAALMLTNPTTLGLFEKNIKEISEIIHKAGGMLYYDGANLNAIMGKVRPGDMGFDVVHLNLHKTFSTPHGGGGPGSGPVGCKAALIPFLPNPKLVKGKRGEYSLEEYNKSIGKINSFYGNFGVYLKALAYILSLGGEGIREAAEQAVLSANYLKAKLEDIYDTDKGRFCMHEFVISIEKLMQKTGVSAKDIAKALIDEGIHPPTMYFPLIVKEALMIEPTETEGLSELDNFVAVMRELYDRATQDPKSLHDAPLSTEIGRPDETLAARNPKVNYYFSA